MNNCQLCNKPLFKPYVIMIGPTPTQTFKACWQCAGPDSGSQFKDTAYTPSYIK